MNFETTVIIIYLCISLVLVPDDLSMLNTHLRGVSKKWYSLGFQLGFTADQLKNLVSTVDVNCDPAVYLSKVLFTWLQRANPPTLEELCRALSHERIGEKKLALQLLHSMFNTPLHLVAKSLNNLDQHVSKNYITALFSLSTSSQD